MIMGALYILAVMFILSTIWVVVGTKRRLDHKLKMGDLLGITGKKEKEKLTLNQARMRRINEIGKLILEGIRGGMKHGKREVGVDLIEIYVDYGKFIVSVVGGYMYSYITFRPVTNEGLHTEEEKDEINKSMVVISPGQIKNSDDFEREDDRISDLWCKALDELHRQIEYKKAEEFLENTAMVEFKEIPEMAGVLKDLEKIQSHQREIQKISNKHKNNLKSK